MARRGPVHHVEDAARRLARSPPRPSCRSRSRRPTRRWTPSASSVSWFGLTPVHRRNARTPRYGQAKIRWAAPPAAPSLLRGAGMSRTRGASRARRRPSSIDHRADQPANGTSDTIRYRMVPQDGSSTRPRRGLSGAHGADPNGEPARHGSRAGRLLLGVLGDQVRLVVLLVEVERLHRHEHARADRVGPRSAPRRCRGREACAAPCRSRPTPSSLARPWRRGTPRSPSRSPCSRATLILLGDLPRAAWW